MPGSSSRATTNTSGRASTRSRWKTEIPFRRHPSKRSADKRRNAARAGRGARHAAAHAGGAALRHRRGAAGGRGLDQRDQVRRLPDAGLDRARQARLVTRNGHDWTARLPALAAAFAAARRAHGAAGWRDGRLAPGRNIQLPRPAGGTVRGPRRPAVLLRLRPAAPERLGSAPLQADRPQAGAVRARGLARHVALQRPPRGRSRRHAPASLRAWGWKGSSASRPTRRTGAGAAMPGSR